MLRCLFRIDHRARSESGSNPRGLLAQNVDIGRFAAVVGLEGEVGVAGDYVHVEVEHGFGRAGQPLNWVTMTPSQVKAFVTALASFWTDAK